MLASVDANASPSTEAYTIRTPAAISSSGAPPLAAVSCSGTGAMDDGEHFRAELRVSGGTCPPEKRRELAHSDARFLVAFKHKQPHRNDDDAADDDDDTPIGFVHFRFEVEDSDGSPVAYVYELQVEDEMKGRGVGTALMAAVESIAKNTQMTRTALTVLKRNKGASLFYERRGYVKDPDTPRDEACHYVILTKPTVKRG